MKMFSCSRDRKFDQFIVIAAHVLLAVLVWLAIVMILQNERKSATSATIRSLNTLANVYAMHAAAIVHEADETLKRIGFEISTTNDELGTFKFLPKHRQGIDPNGVIDRLAWADESGNIISTTVHDTVTSPVNIAERPHFQVHVNAKSDQLYVSAPIKSKLFESTAIYLSRSIRSKSGKFSGVVIAAIIPERLSALYAAAQLSPDAFIALVGTDKNIRAASSPKADRLLNHELGPMWHERLAQNERLTGVFEDGAGRDGVAVVSASPVADLPLRIMIYLPSTEYLSLYWKFREQILVLGVLGTLTLLIGASLTVYASRLSWISREALIKSGAEARSASEQLRLHNERFSTLIDHLTVGVCLYDANNVMLMCNKRFIEMYGLPLETSSKGVTFDQLVTMRQALYSNTGDVRTMDERVRSWHDLHSIGPVSSRVDELVDGRNIRVTRQIMAGGGWVSSHEDITEKRRQHKKILELAQRDPLTGLANRATFRGRIADATALITETDRIAVLLLDLDHFKAVNDSMGHPVGDQLLTLVAMRLKSSIRETDVVARIGGDEFAVIAHDVRESSSAIAVAKRLQKAISAPYSIEGQEIVIGVSIGIAIFPDDAGDAEKLIQVADVALYRAKFVGRNSYQLFEPRMIEEAQQRRELEQQLRAAVNADQFEPYYQPIVDAGTKQVIGFEALMRWCHPEHGSIPPVKFIPVAEETGLILKMGENLLRRACLDMRDLPPQLMLSINVSPVQLRDEHFARRIISILKRCRFAPSRLLVEITEAVLLKDDPNTVRQLVRLRELGIKIVMDDFGTGYSSLSYLLNFPFDTIKIDRSFIANMATSQQSRAVVRAVVDLGKALNMTTTAEGVETNEQYEALLAIGCSHAQGYFFGRPLPAAQAFAGLIAPETAAA